MAQRLPKIKSNIKIVENGKSESLFASVAPIQMTGKRTTKNTLGATANMNKTTFLLEEEKEGSDYSKKDKYENKLNLNTSRSYVAIENPYSELEQPKTMVNT